MYPDMYGDMTGQSTAPAPAPAAAPVASAPQQREPDPKDIALREALSLQDRIDGKTTIQGQVVGGIPSMPVGQAGMSGVVSKFLTGVESQPNVMSKMGLLVGMSTKFNEKAHETNINALIESEGKSGGVGMVWNPKTGWHSVSLKTSDLGESSEFIQGITGETNLVAKSLTGHVPDVFVYNGQVYNMNDNKNRQKFMTDLQANASSVYRSHTIRTVSPSKFTELSGSQSDGTTTQSDGTTTQSDETTTQGGGTTIQSDNIHTDYQDEREKTRLEANKKEAAERYDDKSGDAIADLYKDMEKDDKPGGQFSGGDWGFNTGGKVNSGFIGGKTPFEVSDKQSVADNLTIPAEDKGFVMNAPSIQERPEEFQTMLADAGVEMIDVSAGEYYFKPEDVAKIGLDKLQAFNDRGKPEVSNRIARSGGFINGYAAGDEVNENVGYGDIPDDFFNKVSNFAQKKRQRGEIDTFINELTDQEALSLLFLTETYAGKDPIEHMQRIGDVVLNRASSSNDDFKMQNTIKDVLTFKKSRKKGNKPMYQFDGLEPTSLHKRLTEVTEGGARYAFEKAYAAAENTLNTDPDLEQYRLPENVLYYQKLDPTEDNWMDNNPLLAPLHQFGDHMFYEWFPTADENLFPVREYP